MIQVNFAVFAEGFAQHNDGKHSVFGVHRTLFFPSFPAVGFSLHYVVSLAVNEPEDEKIYELSLSVVEPSGEVRFTEPVPRSIELTPIEGMEKEYGKFVDFVLDLTFHAFEFSQPGLYTFILSSEEGVVVESNLLATDNPNMITRSEQLL